MCGAMVFETTSFMYYYVHNSLFKINVLFKFYSNDPYLTAGLYGNTTVLEYLTVLLEYIYQSQSVLRHASKLEERPEV